MIKLPMFATNSVNRTNSATKRMFDNVCILRVFWLNDKAKIIPKY